MDKGLTIILTGGAGGIGRRLAEVLADRGHHLIITDIDDEALSRHADKVGWTAPRVDCQPLDVREPDQWARIIAIAEERWDRIDVLINLAGVMRPAYLEDIGPDEIAQQLEVNVRGVILGTQLAARHMRERGGGHIINMASMAGVAPVPGLSVYTASKYAVRGFSLAVASELSPHNVAVSILSPDAVQTPMLEMQLDFPAAALSFTARRPLSVDEIARVVVDRVLPKRPLEVLIPPVRGLGARIAGLIPTITSRAVLKLIDKGLRRQEQIRRQRAGVKGQLSAVASGTSLPSDAQHARPRRQGRQENS